MAKATTSMSGRIVRLCWKNPWEVTSTSPAATPAREPKSDSPSRNVASAAVTAARAIGRLAAVSVIPPAARATAAMVQG